MKSFDKHLKTLNKSLVEDDAADRKAYSDSKMGSGRKLAKSSGSPINDLVRDAAKGDVDTTDYPGLTELPNNLKVNGSLTVGDKIKHIPDGTHVTKNLLLDYNGDVETIGNNVKVGGIFNAGSNDIVSIGNSMTVGGKFNCEACKKLKSIGHELSVAGDMWVGSTNLTELPDGLEVGGQLKLQYCKMDSLPDNLFVGKGVYMADSKITKIPESVKITGTIDMSGTKIKSEDIPDHIKTSNKIVGKKL